MLYAIRGFRFMPFDARFAPPLFTPSLPLVVRLSCFFLSLHAIVSIESSNRNVLRSQRLSSSSALLLYLAAPIACAPTVALATGCRLQTVATALRSKVPIERIHKLSGLVAVELSTGVYTQAFQLVLRSMLESLAHSDENRL
jgi:hypothetical protein